MAVRNLIARTGVDLTNWDKGLAKMERDLNKMAKKMEATGKAMTAMFTLPIVALGALSLKTVQYADDLATTSTQLGITAVELQRFNHIAKQTDVSSEALTKSFIKLRSAIGDTLQGKTNASTKALESLGFTMSDLEKMTPEEQFNKTVKALSKIQSSTMQAAYANDIFGDKLANELIPLFKAGEGAIDKYTAEFEKIGYLSNEQVDKLAKFDNEMNRVKATVSIASAELGTAFLPMLQQTLTILEKSVIPVVKALSTAFSSIPAPIQAVITTMLLLLATLGPVLIIYAKLIKLKAILVGWYSAVLVAQKAETAATAANTTVKNIGILTMVKTIALHTAHKIGLMASAIATGVMSAATWVATAAQWALNAAFFASPLGWVALGVIALIAVFVLLWKKLEGFRMFWINLWEGLKSFYKGYINFVIDGLNMYLNSIKFVVNTAIDLLNGLIKTANLVPGIEIGLIPKLSTDSLQIPKFANGGIVYGETIGMMGEYANARSNPEVIAPLDKLKGMLGDNGADTTINVYLGNELLVSKTVKQIGKQMNLQLG